jgi:hypothetical protein
VQKGDTLWVSRASSRNSRGVGPSFWRANRDQIKNLHWIYPGDVVVLTRGADGNRSLLDQTTRLSLDQTTRSRRASASSRSKRKRP